MGRAESKDDLPGEDYERVFETIYEISKTSSFDVKTTEAMHYRRFIAQKQKQEHGMDPHSDGARRVAFRTAGVSDGKGFVFVSHLGDIYPSGFLPVYTGNVRQNSLVDVYRNGGVFQILRDTRAREGKCGICEYMKVCGGSRSRAYWTTGNYMAEDPRCVYQPTGVLATR
jgi:radical SAM protein with 4Fe4S-binding SPASM domain